MRQFHFTTASQYSPVLSANNYNPFMFAWFIDSGCASSVYLNSTRARLTPGLSTFRNFIYFVNLGISQCQRHETGENGLCMIPVGEDKPTPMSTTEAGRKGGSVVRDKYSEDYHLFRLSNKITGC
jgi:hypothetical protein